MCVCVHVRWSPLTPSLSQTGGSGQEEVEEASRDEIWEIVECKEALEKRMAEMRAQRVVEEKEKEEMGVMWGMGEWVVVGMSGNGVKR